MKNKVENYFPEPTDIDKLIEKLNVEGRVSPEFKKFLVYTMERQAYGPDWTDEFVFFSLSSYFILKDKYIKVSRMYKLPPKDFLKEEALTDLKFLPGTTDIVLELLKIKTENCKPHSKICVLVIDEAGLTSELNYWEKYGNVGFEDDGKTKGNLPAHFVTTIWVQGLDIKWTIPFAYYFTHKSCPAAILKECLFDAISKLGGIGIDVIGVITKMRINFHELSQILNISSMNQTFKVENKNVIFLFDVRQLMNITRNNMIKYRFKFEEMQTSWEHVKDFFIKESQSERKSKLTKAHVSPDKTERSCSKFSIELLSNNVATEMMSYISSGKLPESATGTAECIDLFDKIFNIMNSSTETSTNEYTSAYKGSKHQVKFLQKIIHFFENLKVYDKSDRDCTDQVKFINAWLISVKGMSKLREVLNQRKHPYLLTNNINCELLESFMTLLRIRIFSFRDPTPCRFLDLFGSAFASSYFKEWPIDDSNDSEFDIEDYAKKVYKRIPSIIHDLTGETKWNSSFFSKMKYNAPYFNDFMDKWLEICDFVDLFDDF
ncbi:hypothetical protein NQ314_003837 [Rhamnusium bicolor]|uniref:Uncharacterized protein n=1 Tax=Rhamnusium bicolor TaxID=1586634 RepID=A0AAV8ZLB0_9CUCU|nr:hypothetical protein NQ314_003837 [Rhamnusium bicolor]